VEIRWEPLRLRELAAALVTRGEEAMAWRLEAIAAFDRVRTVPCDLRRIVVAAAWADYSADGITRRRNLLEDAERGLLWNLTAVERSPSLPGFRSRSNDDIAAELSFTLERIAWLDNSASHAEVSLLRLEATALRYDLAVAIHAEYVLGVDVPDKRVAATLESAIALTAYRLAKLSPGGVPNWDEVAAAIAKMRGYLDESWFRDVNRRDLLEINALLARLAGPELDAVIAGLSDDEIYRWFHEFDGIGGGNLDVAEEEGLFAMLALEASAAALFRLANGERGSRFAAIAAAVRSYAPDEVALQFIEIAAANAAGSEQALMAALAAIAGLDQRRQIVVASELDDRGLLEELRAATDAFIAKNSLERDSPVVVEFFEGVAAALHSTALGMARLTLGVIVDRHGFREAWAGVGDAARLAFTDPLEFAEAVLDLERLRRNPARWAGGVLPDLLGLAVGSAAKAGSLGLAAQRAQGIVARVGRIEIVDLGRLSIAVRHVMEVVDRLRAVAEAVAAKEMADQTMTIEPIQPGEIGAEETLAAELRSLRDVASNVVQELFDLVRWLADQAAGAGNLTRGS